MKSLKQDIQAKLDEQKYLTNEIFITKNETLNKITLLHQIEKDLDATKREVLLSKEARETEKTRQQEEKQSIKHKIDFLVEEVLSKNLVKKSYFFITQTFTDRLL